MAEDKKTVAAPEAEVETVVETVVDSDEVVVSKTELADMIRASVAEAVEAIDKPERPLAIFEEEEEVAEERTFAQIKPWTEKYSRKTVEFARAVFDPQRMAAYKLRHAMRAAISGGSGDASGGENALPEEFAALIIRDIQKKTVVFPFCRNYPVTERNGKIPVGTLPTVAWTGEKVDLTESTPTFTKDEWSLKKVGGYAKLTREMAEDSGVDLVEYIVEEFSRALARERDKRVVNGDGSTQPEGFYNKSGLTSYAVGGAITYDALVSLIHTLPVRWRANFGRTDPNFPKLIMSDTNVQRVRKLKDTDGRPIFNPVPDQAGRATILGYDFINVGPDIGNDQMFFGSLYQEWVFARRDFNLMLEMSTEATDASGNSAFLQHELWVKVLERWDSAYVQTASMVKATGITG
jgi:HK97 family phage major capsid protein